MDPQMHGFTLSRCKEVSQAPVGVARALQDDAVNEGRRQSMCRISLTRAYSAR